MTAPTGTPIKSEKDLGPRTDNPQVVTGAPAPSGPVAPEKPQRVIMQGEVQPDSPAAIEAKTPAEDRAAKKARLATVLERGIVGDRLQVDLPPDLHGEWVRNDPLEINRLQAVGFEVDNKFATSRSLHNDGTGASIVGDVVFMTCSRETKEIIDEIRHDQFMRMNRPGKSKEEKEFVEAVHAQTGGVIPSVVESQQHSIRTAEIAAALAEVDAQTQPANK